MKDGNNEFQPSGGLQTGVLDRVEVEKVWKGFQNKKFHSSRAWALTVLSHYL